MLKKIMLVVSMSAIIMVVPALGDPGCRNKKFLGSYNSPDLNIDIFGDGSVVKSYALYLKLHSDGTAEQAATRAPELLMNFGTFTPQIGSWMCRNDGKLVVTIVGAEFVPSPLSANTPLPDLTLLRHFRNTYLFAVEDDNTLRRVQRRQRRYTPSQDSTDPAGGTLLPLSTIEVVYTRIIASDADLLAP